MSRERLYVLINKMHIRLNKLIEKNNFDLLSADVLNYSRRLDKVLCVYNRFINKMD